MSISGSCRRDFWGGGRQPCPPLPPVLGARCRGRPALPAGGAEQRGRGQRRRDRPGSGRAEWGRPRPAALGARRIADEPRARGHPGGNRPTERRGGERERGGTGRGDRAGTGRGDRADSPAGTLGTWSPQPCKLRARIPQNHRHPPAPAWSEAPAEVAGGGAGRDAGPGVMRSRLGGMQDWTGCGAGGDAGPGALQDCTGCRTGRDAGLDGMRGRAPPRELPAAPGLASRRTVLDFGSPCPQ